MRGVARFSAAGAGSHVLVVEDDAMIALMLGEMLAEAGYRVSIAGSAETAVELFCLDRPDVATVDVNLPGASGLDLVRHLRRGGYLTPVILVTGSQLSSRDLADLEAPPGGRPPMRWRSSLVSTRWWRRWPRRSDRTREWPSCCPPGRLRPTRPTRSGRT
jgi:CheY-like chemotaxis protein